MRNGSVVYHCKRISNPNDVNQVFAKPEKYVLKPKHLTIQPFSGNIYDNTFGMFRDYTEKGCAYPYSFWDEKINDGDRFYLDKTPEGFETNEEPELGWGYDANFVVNQISKQNLVIYFGLKAILEN